MYKAFYKKITTVQIIIFMAALGLFQDAQANYFDSEQSTDNVAEASSLDIDITTSDIISEGALIPSSSASSSNTIENVGLGDFQYQAMMSITNNDSNVCASLELEVLVDSTQIYLGSLSSFSPSSITLSPGSSDDWDFVVNLPNPPLNSLEGLNCSFDVDFIAWQTNFGLPTQGWTDGNSLSGNSVTTDDWAPVISGVAAVNPSNTKNIANLIDMEIIWDTGESATSEVVYDTASHPDPIADPFGVGYAATAADATADNTEHSVTLIGLADLTTYYYRVVSRDSSGNQSYSDEYIFTVDSGASPASGVVLNEFLPDPAVGNDGDLMPNGEWVELYNKDAMPYDLAGWVIRDSTATNSTVIATSNSDNNGNTADAGETMIPANGYLVVYIGDPSLGTSYLNNSSSDDVRLFDNVATLVDSVTYDASDFDSGKTFARFPDGGVWVDPEPTPGEVNKFTDEELLHYQYIVLDECFKDEKLIKNKKQPMCDPIFVEYVGLIKDKDSKKLVIPSELEDYLEELNKEETVEEEVVIEEKEEDIKKEIPKVELKEIPPAEKEIVIDDPIEEESNKEDSADEDPKDETENLLEDSDIEDELNEEIVEEDVIEEDPKGEESTEVPEEDPVEDDDFDSEIEAEEEMAPAKEEEEVGEEIIIIETE